MSSTQPPALQESDEESQQCDEGVILTPYEQESSGKVILSDQSPSTAVCLRRARALFILYLVAKDAFPDKDTEYQQTGFAFRQGAIEHGHVQRVMRYDTNKEYQDAVFEMLSPYTRSLRDAVKMAVRDFYKNVCVCELVRPDVIARDVSRRLQNVNYLYQKHQEPMSVWRSEVVSTVLSKVFFDIDGPFGISLIFRRDFNPVPVETLALVATAIESGLAEWSTGERREQDISLSAHKYEKRYREHVDQLYQLQRTNPKLVDELRRYNYTQAWAKSLGPPPIAISARCPSMYSRIAPEV